MHEKRQALAKQEKHSDAVVREWLHRQRNLSKVGQRPSCVSNFRPECSSHFVSSTLKRYRQALLSASSESTNQRGFILKTLVLNDERAPEGGTPQS